MASGTASVLNELISTGALMANSSSFSEEDTSSWEDLEEQAPQYMVARNSNVVWILIIRYDVYWIKGI